MNSITRAPLGKSLSLQTSSPYIKPLRINKHKLADGFNKAAGRYNALAKVQQSIAQFGLSRLEGFNVENASTIADIGCGTAESYARLQAIAKHVIGLDISLSMLMQAQQDIQEQDNKKQDNHPQSKQGQHKPISAQFTAINADAEALPFASNSIDVIYSSMALQWCESPQMVLNEVSRVLAPRGKALLCILTGESFASLQNAWRRSGLPSRINQFTNKDVWVDAAQNLELESANICKSFSSYHPSVIDMLQSIKRIGANTRFAGSQAASSYLSKHEVQALTEHIRRHDNDEKGFALQYELLFLTLEK